MPFQPLRTHPDAIARRQMLARLLQRSEASQPSSPDGQTTDEQSLGNSAASSGSEGNRAATRPGMARDR